MSKPPQLHKAKSLPNIDPNELPTFDPEVYEHREAYATFLFSGKWPMKFKVEVPQWQNMYDMVRAKMAEHACAPIIRRMKRDVERAQKKAARIAAEAAAAQAATEAAEIKQVVDTALVEFKSLFTPEQIQYAKGYPGIELAGNIEAATEDQAA